MQDKYLTVTQLTKYLKFKIDNDPNLVNVFLKGEISNFKAHTRGHLYFTIKDENSRINAIMFGNDAKKLSFIPQDGMKIMVTGRISVYEASGAYQIYVNELIEDGIGNLYVKFEQLKKQLKAEGLFDEKYKKEIPKIPNRIGVITASTGAAVRDILTTIKRRWPLVDVLLFPALVQGEFAANDIARQIKRAQDFDIDTLIVGRGGGSIEDLWAFNEEVVARSIFESKIPIISAVGHEVDFTIADFVADLRAPTPTAAAELAVPNKLDFYNHLKQIDIRLNKVIENNLTFSKTRLNNIKQSFIFSNPINIYMPKEEQFDLLFERLKFNIINIKNYNSNKLEIIKNSYIFKNPNLLYDVKKQKYVITKEKIINNFNNYINLTNMRYDNVINKLEVLNPLLTLKRGYSITKKEKKVISKVSDVKKDEVINIEVSDGEILAKVL